MSLDNGYLTLEELEAEAGRKMNVAFYYHEWSVQMRMTGQRK